MNEELYKAIEDMTIGLDDTFKFQCNMCGKCCIGREDILISPHDLFRLAKFFNMTPQRGFEDFCEFYFGESSNVPIVRLKMEGPQKRCPMLHGKKCMVQDAKPSVCAMFPLGRYMKFDMDNFTAEEVAKGTVQYILQPIDGGKRMDNHTVREWLAGFNMEAEDAAYIKWNMAIAEIGPRIKKLRTIVGKGTMLLAETSALVALYLNYSTEKEFLPQFERNAAEFIETIKLVDKAAEDGVPIP